MKKILSIVFVVALSLLSLMLSLEYHSFNPKHYEKNFIKNNIEQETGKTLNELNSIANDLMEYLKINGGEELLEPNFNEKEILHMVDVQLLFKYGFFIKYISIAVIIGIVLYFIKKRNMDFLGKASFIGLFSNWAIIGILGILIYTDFNKYFVYFHEIFFTNDLWLLDPQTDLLIQMLPENFFSTMAFNIVLSFLLYVATIQVIGFVTYKKGSVINEKLDKLFKK